MNNKIYFDIAATTPMDREVSSFIYEIQNSIYGNPSSIHRCGQEARAAIETARRQVANSLGCMPKEIIFTAGGSESNNIALNGCLNKGDHLITSSYEHPAVLKVAKDLEQKGIEVTYIKPSQGGIIETEKVELAIKANTKLISVMYVNNEIGTINPLSDIVKIAENNNILFHSDAVQYFGKHKIDLKKLNVDFLCASAHKFYGPKGVGFLYKKHSVALNPTIHGGGQELNLRPGTENIAGIAGLGLATEIAHKSMDENIKKVKDLENQFISCLDKTKIKYRVNGRNRLCGILNITFFDISGQDLLMKLDLNNIAISFGSACSSGTMKASQILLDIDMPIQEAQNTVRISIGKIHSYEEIDHVVKLIANIIDKKNGI